MLNKLKKLHRDESGLKTLEVVAILAIAAIILAVIKTFWNNIKTWFDKSVKNTTEEWKGQPGDTAPGGPPSTGGDTPDVGGPPADGP